MVIAPAPEIRFLHNSGETAGNAHAREKNSRPPWIARYRRRQPSWTQTIRKIPGGPLGGTNRQVRQLRIEHPEEDLP
jgi:hypothetical protein